MKTNIWGKCVSGATKKLEKASSFVKIETSRCFLDSLHIEQRMSSRAEMCIVSLYHFKSIRWKTFVIMLHLDCKQSLFFFRFRKGSARARFARNEGVNPIRKKSCLSRLAPSSRAWSFACPWRFARRTKKKERLFVAYATLQSRFPSFKV